MRNTASEKMKPWGHVAATVIAVPYFISLLSFSLVSVSGQLFLNVDENLTTLQLAGCLSISCTTCVTNFAHWPGLLYNFATHLLHFFKVHLAKFTSN